MNKRLNPLVSVIIPTFNRAHLILDTLKSIKNQTYNNWECIIVDDGSTDNTEIVLKSYINTDSRFKFYNSPINLLKGPNSCRNYGFKKSSGEYVYWFDSDDILMSDALETYVNSSSKNIDVVIAKLERVDFNNSLSRKENNIFSKNLIEDYFIGKVAFYICGPFWKRSFLEKQIYLFDESIKNLDDWDFNLRMLYEKPKIYFINKVLIKYRIHDNSLSKEINKLNFQEIQSEFKAREKHIELLKNIGSVDVMILKKYTKNRYKHVLRESLVKNHPQKTFFLKKLLLKQIILFDFLGVVKTIVGFVFYSLFNKGYILLK